SGRDPRAGLELAPAVPARLEAADRDHGDPHAPRARAPVVTDDPEVGVAGREPARRVAHEQPLAAALERHHRARDARVAQLRERVQPEGVVDEVRVRVVERRPRLLAGERDAAARDATARVIVDREARLVLAPAHAREVTRAIPEVLVLSREGPRDRAGLGP